jgi:ElaB/YqjD/DUF883 family membrane-anchored ribosome-binding protein
VAEERDQVTRPVGSLLAPDQPGATSLAATGLDDVVVPRRVSTADLGPGVSGDRIDATIPPGVTAASGTGAFATPSSDDPDVIREQIERTREDMSQTINELQERLSPQHLAQQARESVREATVGRVQQLVGSAGDTATQVARRAQEAAGPMVEQVRERPVPIALAGVGVGLAWWLMRRASSRQTWSSEDMYNWDDDPMSTSGYRRDQASLDYNDDRNGGRWQDGGWMRVLRDNPLPASIAAASIGYMLWNRRSSVMADDYRVRSEAYAGYDDEDIYGAPTTERVSDAARDLGRQAREKATALGEQARERATALGEQAREKASALGEQARDKASALGETAREKASALSEQVSGTVRSARLRAGQVSRQTSTQFDHWLQENPLAVGIAAVAAGAVVGLTMPRTRAENQVMGASRDALIDRASDSAQQLKDQVRDKVQEVADDLTSTTSSTPSSPTGVQGV